MSISAKTRAAGLAAVLLTAILLVVALVGGRAARDSNDRVAAAMTLLMRHEATDDVVRELRTDVGKATRGKSTGVFVPDSDWDALDRRFQALAKDAAGYDTQRDDTAKSALEVAAVGRAVVAAGRSGTLRLPLINDFAGKLRVFEQARDAAGHRLSVNAMADVGRSFDITRWWSAILVLGGAATVAMQLGFGLWLRRAVAMPIAQMADSLGAVGPTPPRAEDLARNDEIGTLARAALAYREDAFERQETASRLEHALRHDALTGLLGRQAFDEALAGRLAAAKPDESIALFTLDLDRFKDINDANGHAGGDLVLKRVADTLRYVCVESEIVGRLGGDEFAVVQAGGVQPSDARRLAARMLEAFGNAGIGVSVGVALYPRDADEEMRLRHYSDLALYRAKHEGRGRVRFFGSGRAQAPSSPTGYVPMPSELGAAIAAGDLRLHYQPKMRARTGAIDSIEALVRWQHPTRGLVAPDNFIRVAEKMGQIRSLTEWTLERAVADQIRLAEDGRILPIYVNLSACLLGDAGFTRSALKIVAGRVGEIGLEVTETGVIDDPQHAFANLQDFVDAGMKIAIDDYGAGMSSLSYLKRLPAHELKIDRTFVAELSRSHRDPLIVRSTIDLAHALGLEVTAEGVEKLSSFALLRAMGCDLIQGFLVARPMPLEALLTFLADRNALSHLENADTQVRVASGL